MRYLITWTSPIVYHQGDDKGSMGVYGVEGSKPGAAAVATWLTHKTLGLEVDGYGRLLGEAIFTCTKVCATNNPNSIYTDALTALLSLGYFDQA